MTSRDLYVARDNLCLVTWVVVHQRKIMTKVGCHRLCGYWEPGQMTEERKKRKKRVKNSMLAEKPANIKRPHARTVPCLSPCCTRCNSIIYRRDKWEHCITCYSTAHTPLSVSFSDWSQKLSIYTHEIAAVTH